LAEWSRNYPALQAAGAELVALSVDQPEKAAAMKSDLRLAFTVLCDPARTVITPWNLVNHKEKDIAIPSVFVIDHGLNILHRVIESTTSRANPADVLEVIRTIGSGNEARNNRAPRFVWPGAMFLRAIRNAIKYRA